MTPEPLLQIADIGAHPTAQMLIGVRQRLIEHLGFQHQRTAVETEAQPDTLMPKNEQQQERRIYPVDVVWRGSVRGG